MDSTDIAADRELIEVSVHEEHSTVVTVTIDRPAARNAMNEQLRSELKASLDDIAASEARVVVLTGSDEASTFVSGADVSDLRDRDLLEQRAWNKRRKVYDVVSDLPQPVIARINGHAMGGGLEIALACDIRVAAPDIKIGFPEITLGLIPGGGGTQRLARLIGEGQAKRLILTGDPVSADQAYDLGIVDVLADENSLDETVFDLAGRISQHSPIALGFAKEAISASSRLPLNDGIKYESQLFQQLFATEDKNEGIDAFLENREPNWTGL